jgi:hypothetical protein
MVAGFVLVVGRLISRRSTDLTAVPDAKNTKSVDPFTGGSIADQRFSARRNAGSVAVHVANVDTSEPPVQGSVIDRSMGGLGLLLPKTLAEGAHVRIRACEANVTTPWVEVEVKSCRKQGKNWQIGCKFVKTPPYNVLLTFA